MNSITISFNSIYHLDFGEAQQIAEMVNFDIMTCAKKLRCCGPGCDYFSKDKKYFVTMLLKHIHACLQNGESCPPEVLVWYEKAAAAEQEYRIMEERHLQRRRWGSKATT